MRWRALSLIQACFSATVPVTKVGLLEASEGRCCLCSPPELTWGVSPDLLHVPCLKEQPKLKQAPSLEASSKKLPVLGGSSNDASNSTEEASAASAVPRWTTSWLAESDANSSSVAVSPEETTRPGASGTARLFSPGRETRLESKAASPSLEESHTPAAPLTKESNPAIEPTGRGLMAHNGEWESFKPSRAAFDALESCRASRSCHEENQVCRHVVRLELWLEKACCWACKLATDGALRLLGPLPGRHCVWWPSRDEAGHARPRPQDLCQGSSHWQLASDEPSRDGPRPTTPPGSLPGSSHWQLASDEPSRDEAGPCPTGSSHWQLVCDAYDSRGTMPRPMPDNAPRAPTRGPPTDSMPLFIRKCQNDNHDLPWGQRQKWHKNLRMSHVQQAGTTVLVLLREWSRSEKVLPHAEFAGGFQSERKETTSTASWRSTRTPLACFNTVGRSSSTLSCGRDNHLPLC